jgi:hypothetical protein
VAVSKCRRAFSGAEISQAIDGLAGRESRRHRISAVWTKNRRGEGGIRTLGTLLGYGALAKRCFRPLSHLTNKLAEYGEEIPIANLDILGRGSAVGKADSFPSEASSFAAVQRNRLSQLPITDCQMK